MSIKDILETNVNKPPYDLALKLGPQGIRKLLEIMWIAYNDLNIEAVVTSDFDENAITQEWFMRIQRRWAPETSAFRIILYPVQQYEDNTLAKKQGQKPTIDFCFRGWNRYEGYFGAECKILMNGKRIKYKRYIKTGIQNFTSGRYGSKCSTSAMIGYIVKGPVPEVIEELKQYIEQINPISSLSRDLSWEEYPHYKSKHHRTYDGSSIILHHMMFNFS